MVEILARFVQILARISEKYSMSKRIYFASEGIFLCIYTLNDAVINRILILKYYSYLVSTDT